MNKLALGIGGGTLALIGGGIAAAVLVLRTGPSPARGTIAARALGGGRCHGQVFTTVSPLFTVPARGGVRRLLLRGRPGSDPSWSPDGRSLALSVFSCGVGAKIRVAVADPRSGRVRLLTAGPFDREPAWSPDGRTIAFVRQTQGKHGGSVTRLFMVPAAGGRARPVGTSLHVENPTWSPDGRELAVTRGRSGVGLNEPASIYALRPDGSGLRRITRGTSADWRPAWSPDGKWIVFTRLTVPAEADLPPQGLFLVHPDGTGLHRLTKGSFFDPAWSPDGKYVVAAGRDYPDVQNPLAGFSLRIMQAHGRLAGTRYRRWTVTRRDGLDFEPTWRAQ